VSSMFSSHSMAVYRRRGAEFLKGLHNDPDAAIGCLLVHIEDLERRLDEQTKINKPTGSGS
jgi:hypothetical protein